MHVWRLLRESVIETNTCFQDLFSKLILFFSKLRQNMTQGSNQKITMFSINLADPLQCRSFPSGAGVCEFWSWKLIGTHASWSSRWCWISIGGQFLLAVCTLWLYSSIQHDCIVYFLSRTENLLKQTRQEPQPNTPDDNSSSTFQCGSLDCISGRVVRHSPMLMWHRRLTLQFALRDEVLFRDSVVKIMTKRAPVVSIKCTHVLIRLHRVNSHASNGISCKV